MHRFRGVRYWKPIQTGVEQDDDTAEVRRLGACAPGETLNAGIRLPRPVSPHLAARLSGRPIDVGTVVASGRPDATLGSWIIEGAGGVLVPINDSALMVDVMTALGLPVLVVARAGLGTINHTLLTLEALRARQLTVAGVVMVGEPDAENRAAIDAFGHVPVLGELPILDPLTPEALGAWAQANLDTGNLLKLGT